MSNKTLRSGRERRISAVVITRNEGAELKRTVENLNDTLPPGGEVVVVDDGSTDRSSDRLEAKGARIRVRRVNNFGVARARNLGARESRGDIVVFCDAHIRLEPFWWRPLAELLEDPRVGASAPGVTQLPPTRRTGYGLTFTGPSLDVRWLLRRPDRPCEVPILTGCCCAMRRDVFLETGGWDEGMLQRGNVDNEGCVRLWMLGYDLMVTPETVVQHLFRPKSPYTVGWPEYLHNRLRLAFLHLSPPRLRKVIAALHRRHGFGEALALVADGDLAARRRELRARKTRGDDCYFERFGLKW